MQLDTAEVRLCAIEVNGDDAFLQAVCLVSELDVAVMRGGFIK